MAGEHQNKGSPLCGLTAEYVSRLMRGHLSKAIHPPSTRAFIFRDKRGRLQLYYASEIGCCVYLGILTDQQIGQVWVLGTCDTGDESDNEGELCLGVF